MKSKALKNNGGLARNFYKHCILYKSERKLKLGLDKVTCMLATEHTTLRITNARSNKCPNIKSYTNWRRGFLENIVFSSIYISKYLIGIQMDTQMHNLVFLKQFL